MSKFTNRIKFIHKIKIILLPSLLILTAIWGFVSFKLLKENPDFIPLCIFIPNILISLGTLLFNLLLTLIYGGILLIIDFILYLNLVKITFEPNTISLFILILVGAFEFVIFSYYNRLQIERRSSELTIEEQQELYNVRNAEYLKNVLKNQKLKEELNRMKKLSQTATLLGTAFNSSEDIISYILKETRKILQVKRILFSMPNKDEKHFVIKNIYGYNKKYIGQHTDNLDEWLKVLKRPVYISDIEKEGRIKLKRYSNFSNARSIIASPILLKNEVYGVLRIESDKTNAFTNDDLRVLSYITDMATIVVENNFYFKEVEKLAVTDGITGLYVHRYFLTKLDIEVERYFRYNTPLSLIMLDIDNFKILNDTYGHQFGDKVLITVAQTIKSEIREVDFPARYGGDEFAIILPHTNIKGAKSLGERLFNKICSINLNLLSGNTKIKHSLTVSMGVGSFKKIYKDSKTFIDKVDKKLYKAKAKGKKRIEIIK